MCKREAWIADACQSPQRGTILVVGKSFEVFLQEVSCWCLGLRSWCLLQPRTSLWLLAMELSRFDIYRVSPPQKNSELLDLALHICSLKAILKRGFKQAPDISAKSSNSESTFIWNTPTPYVWFQLCNVPALQVV